MPHQERVNIAVFIDFDNIEIGVKSTLGEHFDIGIILEALKERGEVVTKIAYADWTRAGEYSRALTQHAIRLVQRNLTPGGDKNGADINLALDALEMVFTHSHINAYVIVGGDSDFLSLVEKLKQYDKKVFVVGGRAFTSIILQRNCHEFIAYENLMRKPVAAPKGGRPAQATAAAPLTHAFPLVRRALKILADREVSPQTGLLKSTLLQLDSTFSERNYGASSFLDFVEKLAQVGLVLLKHAGRSVMVELNPAFEDGDASATAETRSAASATTVAAPGTEQRVQVPTAEDEGGDQPQPGGVVHAFRAPEPPPQIGDQAEGVRRATELVKGATTARWPMYLRNVKQILRAGGFDERRYGFGGLIDLLRACGRDGLVRLERDRRGGLRVMQGPSFVQAAAAASEAARDEQPRVEAAPPIEVADGFGNVAVDEFGNSEPDVIEIQPMAVVDTTAELLGRANARRPRSRMAPSPVERSAVAAKGRRPAVKKPAAPRRARTAKKGPAASARDNAGNK